MNSKIKIIFADPCDIYLKSMAALFDCTEDLKMVGEAHNEMVVIDMLKKKTTDVLILTRKIQFKEHTKGLHSLKEKFPELKIIVLSETNILAESLDLISGANCYLSTSCTALKFLEAIRWVYHKGYFFDHSGSKSNPDPTLSPDLVSDDLQTFNHRESAVLMAICDGKTNKEIANILHLSPSTVDFYRTRIYAKTKCNNGITLLRYALKRGIIKLN
jgi:DNA-binding NarL/FixJ family response regulator